jgi:hypothetical protein
MEEGIAQIRESLAAQLAMGTASGRSAFLVLLAVQFDRLILTNLSRRQWRSWKKDQRVKPITCEHLPICCLKLGSNQQGALVDKLGNGARTTINLKSSGTSGLAMAATSSSSDTPVLLAARYCVRLPRASKAATGMLTTALRVWM